MKKVFLIINIFMLLGLTACQQGKETVIEKHYGPGTDLPTPPKSNVGGIDGAGGGNGIDGKPLESYRVQISQVPAFQVVQRNVIDKLITRFPELAADLTHIAEERNWYLVPIDLRQLPSSNIGTFFRTDQMALQGLREIWMNDLIFSKMDQKSQSMLLLHELVMGLRLLPYTNAFDQCLVKIGILKFDPSRADDYKKGRQLCFRNHKGTSDAADSIGLGRQAQLESSDYENIRDLNYKLMTNAGSIDIDELKSRLNSTGFRQY